MNTDYVKYIAVSQSVYDKLIVENTKLQQQVIQLQQQVIQLQQPVTQLPPQTYISHCGGLASCNFDSLQQCGSYEDNARRTGFLPYVMK